MRLNMIKFQWHVFELSKLSVGPLLEMPKEISEGDGEESRFLYRIGTLLSS